MVIAEGEIVDRFQLKSVIVPVKIRTQSSAIANSSADFQTGGYASGTAYDWDGFIGEFRISKTARSADWIVTEYNNQNSPSTFYTVGSQQ